MQPVRVAVAVQRVAEGIGDRVVARPRQITRDLNAGAVRLEEG